MQWLTTIAQWAGCITTVAAAIALLIKPLRERLLGLRSIQEGQRCLLRADMLHTYYKHRETQTIRQYEYENFIMEYKAYKALHGNSFVEHIYEEVKSWEILT